MLFVFYLLIVTFRGRLKISINNVVPVDIGAGRFSSAKCVHITCSHFASMDMPYAIPGMLDAVNVAIKGAFSM